MNQTDGWARETEELNRRAYLAMSRVNAGVVARLVELLRSDVPIDPVVRGAMADAFEGKNQRDRVTFKIVGLKDGPLGDWAERRHRFHRDMAIARFIKEPREMTLAEASEEAARHFGSENLSPRTCKEAVAKELAFRRWTARNGSGRPDIFLHLSEERYQLLLEVEYFDAMEAGIEQETPWFIQYQK